MSSDTPAIPEGPEASPTLLGRAKARGRLRRPSGSDLRSDAAAGLVLGVESVPDGLASGLLAGVNPLAGLYGYLFGMVGAAALTSSTFMAVQATGAMALVVGDVDLASRDDPERALFTLAVLTGVVMVLAGVFRAGTLIRFVPTAVMTGFVTAVGVNIILGQLSNLTGYDAVGSNRVTRTIDLLLHPGRVDPATLTVGVLTGIGILLLTRTRLRSLGMVLAVVLGSALAAVLNDLAGDAEGGIALVRDIAAIPRSLPGPTLPVLRDIGFLLLPALSLAFVGLVQGAAVSAGVPNLDGRPADTSRDFVGQGAGNLVAGIFQGMPVGGSMSASALVVAGGARTRMSLVFAGGVMALVILLLADLVGHVAMPALAALLITVGAGAIKPAQVQSVTRTGGLQTAVMAVTFGLTLLIPLQYAVLTGVGMAIVLHVAQQSNRLTVRRLEFASDGRIRETEPPSSVPPETVVVLQPYGSLFFASAPLFRAQLPAVSGPCRGTVVILRLRGIDQLGLSLIDVVRAYARDLIAAGGSLKIVISSDNVERQLSVEGVTDLIGEANVYLGTQWLGTTVRAAHDDAQAALAAGKGDTSDEQ